jgi:predicted aspartyl protease
MNPRAAVGKILGRCALAATMALLAAPSGSLNAQTVAPAAPTPGPTGIAADDAASKPDYEAAARPDQIGRIIVPVMVNGRGPFSFVLDTGANRTVVTPQLLATLGLQSAADESVTMNGATGSAVVPTARIERIAAGDVVLTRQQLPVAGSLAIGIDGILGVDALEEKRVLVDFKTGKIEIRAARHQRPIPGAARISAEWRFGRLMIIDAYVDRIRVKAVVDTGSEYTLGNDALHEALYARARGKLPYTPINVLGETLALQRGEREMVKSLRVGDVRAEPFNIVFGEFYVFKLWDLDTQPALVIGMDLIGKLDEFVIDYERREVQLRARARDGEWFRR